MMYKALEPVYPELGLTKHGGVTKRIILRNRKGNIPDAKKWNAVWKCEIYTFWKK